MSGKKAKRRIYILIAALTALLIALTVVFCVVLHNKNTDYRSVDAKLHENSVTITEYESKIAEAQKTNSDLQSQLDEANSKNQQLTEENAKIKKEMESLAAKKRQQAAQAAKAAQEAKQASAEPNSKICYLTFDDGPSDNTLKILDILKSYDAKATFFVVNTKQIDYVKQIHAAGHTVGLHSNSHNYDIYKSRDAFLADLQAISNAVEQRIGIKSKIMRFPGGSSNAVSKSRCTGIMTDLTAYLPSIGYSYFDWNVSSGDASGNNIAAATLKNNVLTSAKNKNSICVLMHDTAAKTTTVQALPGMIEGLRAMGYRFEALTAESYGYHHKVAN